MVELVDTLDLKSSGHRGRTGSSPVPGTLKVKALYHWIRGFFGQIGATVLNSIYPLSQLRFRGSTFLGILKQ